MLYTIAIYHARYVATTELLRILLHFQKEDEKRVRKDSYSRTVTGLTDKLFKLSQSPVHAD